MSLHKPFLYSTDIVFLKYIKFAENICMDLFPFL